MRNIVSFTEPEEIHEYVRNLWRTSLFQESHDAENGYIKHVVNLLAKRPAIFFEMDEPEIEWSQFTTWMGAYALRPSYENDAIHDLYYLHEFWHGATMKYEGDLPFVQWHRKMCENEMLASAHSEAYVYFALRGLREQSFDFEIWVDRFLSNSSPYPAGMGAFPGQWRHMQFLIDRRKDAMKSPDPFDFLEMQIHQYALQNIQWSNIWKDRYREVESHMEKYLEECGDNKEEAVESHITWLLNAKFESFLSSTAKGHVTPYQEEAEAFGTIVKENKKRWGNNVLKT